ncbi:hypothetical protein CTI12_AA331900 [Artemisia annua]|uniref:Uncharacterized protein n=1 Tax=Artemisia annua TaxID=35608 RepID=A0A2U1MWG5_ARTAN|nr:hypothetical protein CTI12_AA331900 [Artemisia annua]
METEQQKDEKEASNKKEAEEKSKEQIHISGNKKRKVYPTLKERTTVKPFFEAMHALNVERKKVIRQMGFGKLIDFPISEVPTKLAFFVVDILDTETMNLRLPTGNLQISPQTVKVVLGLPKGSRRLERNEEERENNDQFEQEWKDQYKDENKLTINEISKMNFLMLVANTFAACNNTLVVKTTVLENILEEDDVRYIDRCTYVYECARLSKKHWATRKRDKTEVDYYGPVTFLMLAYLQYTKFDGINVQRRITAFKSWDANLLKSREILELDNTKYFGMVDIIGGLNGQEIDAQMEEIYQILEDKLENISNERDFFEELIKENLYKFGKDKRLIQYRERLKNIFKNTNEAFQETSPFSSSTSTESSSINFGTSDDEDDNNGDEGDKKPTCADENGDSMIVDDDEADKHDAPNDYNEKSNFDDDENTKGIGKDEDSQKKEGSSNIRNEDTGMNEVRSKKDSEAAENKKVTSQKIDDEKVNEEEEKPEKDFSMWDEIINKTDDELRKEFRELREKQNQMTRKKDEDILDEVCIELCKKIERETIVKKHNTGFEFFKNQNKTKNLVNLHKALVLISNQDLSHPLI